MYIVCWQKHLVLSVVRRILTRHNAATPRTFKMGKLIWITAAVISAFIAYKISNYCKPPALPVLPLDQHWGPGSPLAHDISIRPFKVAFEDEMIEDLKERLAKHRPFAPPLEGIGFEYGFNTNYLNKVVSFWKDEYDFKEREQFLNKYPQFVTNIQGLDIHFLHVKPVQTNRPVRVVPLLILHGWPGSVREFYEIIPLLTTPQPGKDFLFEVIAPSQPGFGFSQATAKPGLGPAEISVILRNLMARLGFGKFVIQGGDWGSIVGSHLATLFPNETIGYHTNMPFLTSPSSIVKWILGAAYPPLVVDDNVADRMYPLSEKIPFILEEYGYLHIQSTKPDTVGVGLNDSPAGLAAYILEKFSIWSGYDNIHAEDGKITKAFKLVDLVDNLMIYWLNNSITSSMRLYAENFSRRNLANNWDSIPTSAPTAVINFKYELMFRPESHMRSKYPNLLQFTVHEHTGHFAALETPKALADDLWEATVKFLQFRNDK